MSASVLSKICSCLDVCRLMKSKQALAEAVIHEFSEGGQIENEPIRIPLRCQEDSNRKTLVLDLDETLITSSCLKFAHADLKLKVHLMRGQEKNVWVKFRPGVTRFLKELSEIYELIIFTASIKEYANAVIDYLDSENIVDFRMFRENCSFDERTGSLFKDLSLLNRNLSDVIIIDNSPNMFRKQSENGIRISDFKIDDQNDSELLNLLPFLRFISGFQDVRPVAQYWQKYQSSESIKYIDINGMDCEFTRGALNLYDEYRMQTELSESDIDQQDLKMMNADGDGVSSDDDDDDDPDQKIVIEGYEKKQSIANSKNRKSQQQRNSIGGHQAQQSMQGRKISNNNGGGGVAEEAKGKVEKRNTKSLFDFSAFKSSIYNKIRTSDSTSNTVTTNVAAAAGGGGGVGDSTTTAFINNDRHLTKKQGVLGYAEVQENSAVEVASSKQKSLFDTSTSQSDQQETFIKKPKNYTKPHSRRCASQQIKFATLSVGSEHFHSPLSKEV